MADPFTTPLSQQQIQDLLDGKGPSLATSALDQLRNALATGDDTLTPQDAGLLAVPQDDA